MVKRKGPRGKDYCVLCNPGGYGKKATEDPNAEAIAEYYLGGNEPPTGWQPICEWCVPLVRRQGFGSSLRPLDGYEDHPVFSDSEESIEHDCENPSWTKVSLVTESEGFDWVECDDCGIYGKRWGLTKDTIEVVGYER